MNMPGPVLYTVRTRDGLEVGPMSLEQVSKLAQEGQFSSTAMVYRSDKKRLQPAAAIPENRKILPKFNPRHDSQIRRLRQGAQNAGRDSRQFRLRIKSVTGTHAKIKKTGLFYKIFPFMKK